MGGERTLGKPQRDNGGIKQQWGEFMDTNIITDILGETKGCQVALRKHQETLRLCFS